MDDLLVIGGGSAGITFAKFGASLGAKITVIEANKLGGDCTWTGCVPSKSLIHAAKIAHTTATAARYGISAQPSIDFAAVMGYVHSVQQQIYQHDDAPEVLRQAGARVIEGRARFYDDQTVEVNGELLRAKHFCIATGSHPKIPTIPGLAEAGYLTNEDVFLLEALPKRIVVLGGGPIGCELGQALFRLGAEVTIIQQGPRLLPKDDHAMGAALAQALKSEGLQLYLNTKTLKVELQAGAKQLTIQTANNQPQTIVADAILVAAGRTPNLHNLGLDAAGILYDPEQRIHVDHYLRTSNPRVFACGDVIGRYQFTHVAAQEAGLVLRNALFPGQSAMKYELVPWATFTDPEVGHVGLNEDQARAKYGSSLRVYELPWSANDRARTEDATQGFTKILAVGRKEQIVGVHIIGQGAGDMINAAVLAMGTGVSASKLGGLINVYPTRSQGLKMTAQRSFTRWLEKPWLQRALRWYFR
ncbi:MAG TPA: pyridine nucleotide-disulfide oxidoreductase [Herpetosiphon sp.]|uniref:Pyridine nucleotide-disulphide oxidoreductase dimerisation region n=1 Tax=Herpetosiphon aurantiacus (strain ATCC 23779 / DSM 785 / 114-95) TaxID=316274 RepID=A9B4W4_HERA2|nr:FAD-dependent oxidoreductase [Herpetosiphon sp.]ABX05687.1 pyridine nucleotide-disulphide oxidoreductase dimerisation region [Herpetosiphon aurantiacus DSM 785]HBW51536.1 pyridine nucleotide-disulfide oxidoreductase [Herpetosiphon sp.]